MIGETEITRMGTGGYSLGFELKDIFIEDNRNSAKWVSQGLVTGIMDVLESPNVLEDGTGEAVDKLYKRIVTERNALARQGSFGDFKLTRDGSNARILKVRYQTINDRSPQESLEVVFQDYVQMKRPRYLVCERKVTDTFRGANELESRVL
jgi:hypothetical protein